MLTWFAACPKCSGDLQRVDGVYGPERRCTECGHRDVEPMLRIPRAPRVRPRLLVRVPARFMSSRRAA